MCQVLAAVPEAKSLTWGTCSLVIQLQGCVLIFRGSRGNCILGCSLALGGVCWLGDVIVRKLSGINHMGTALQRMEEHSVSLGPAAG